MEQENIKYSQPYAVWLIEIAAKVIVPLVLVVLFVFVSTWIVIGQVVGNINDVTDFWETILCFSLPMFLAMSVLPVLFELLIKKNTLERIGLSYKSTKANNIFLALNFVVLVISFILIFCTGMDFVYVLSIILSFLFVAISEEIMMRGILMDTMTQKMPWLFAAVINSLIFAFVYHSSDDALVNLIWRFPLGFILCVVAKKSGSVYQGIIIHFWVNILVNVIPSYFI